MTGKAKEIISLEAGVLIQEITKRPKLEKRFPMLFKATFKLSDANSKVCTAQTEMSTCGHAYRKAVDEMKEAEDNLKTAILTQADAFMEEVVKK